MPCLNPGAFLEEAVRSCLEQPELGRLIIADGGSDAATQHALANWARSDSRVTWWSRPDGGPAAALQAALAAAEGAQFIGWLNADDRYEAGALERAVSFLHNHPQFQMVYGHGRHIDQEGQFLELYPTRSPDEGLPAFQHGSGICQPTVVMRKAFLDQLRGFDHRWRVAFDLDLWLRAFAAAPDAIGFLPVLQASTRLHARTLTSQQQWRVNLETALLLQRSLGEVADHWLGTAASELWSQPAESRDSAMQLLALQPSLRSRMDEALMRLQPIESQELDQSCPLDLQLLLHSRQDLIGCGFHQPVQQRAFAQWLLLHGLREYPALQHSPELLAWFGAVDDGGWLPRIAQAIWDSTASHQRRWSLPKRAQPYQRWLKGRWQRLGFEGLPPYATLFGPGLRQRWLQRLASAKRLALVSAPPRPLARGVHLIGYANSALGIGEDVRTTAVALQRAGVGVSVEPFRPGDLAGRDLKPTAKVSSADARYATSVLCLTAEETVRYVLSEGRSLLEGRYVIGYWPWELPHWPAPWLDALGLVDEVWASSRHIQRCLEAVTSKPVLHMPLCVDAEALALQPLSTHQRREHRLAWGFPEQGVLAFCSFDWSSASQRKNPWGAIQAFQRAFPPALVGGCRSDVGLVVKTFRPARPNREWDRLQHVAALDPRIHLVEATLERDALSALYGCCDVLLSLHRAEGFGRVLAEALQLGLDVIATQWSGNIDFCDGPLAHAVPFDLVEVPPAAYPHWHGQHWAEPDLSVAARLLEQVVERRFRDGLPPMRWAMDYRDRFSAQTCGQRYRARLEELGLLSAREEHSGVVPR